jgi:hypothetical protein
LKRPTAGDDSLAIISLLVAVERSAFVVTKRTQLSLVQVIPVSIVVIVMTRMILFILTFV